MAKRLVIEMPVEDAQEKSPARKRISAGFPPIERPYTNADRPMMSWVPCSLHFRFHTLLFRIEAHDRIALARLLSRKDVGDARLKIMDPRLTTTNVSTVKTRSIGQTCKSRPENVSFPKFHVRRVFFCVLTFVI